MIPHTAAGYRPQAHTTSIVCYNSHSQHEQKLRTASALPIDPFGLTGFQLEVSRSFTTWIIGSWLQPCGPVTRTAGSRPTAGSWGHWNQKFSHGNGPSKTIAEAVFVLLRSGGFKQSGRTFLDTKSNFSESCVFDFSEMPTLIFNRLNPRNGPPCPCTSFLVSSLFCTFMLLS